MTSYSHGKEWTPILLEAAKSVRKSVGRVLRRMASLGEGELKRLLDLEAEKAVEETIHNLGASAYVVSEECEAVIGGGGAYIIVDPVDGTTNLAKGIPFAVTSLAVSETPKMSDAVAALVMDLRTGEVYCAEQGGGSRHGRRCIRPSRPKPMDEAFISLDISKGAPLDPVRGIISEARHLRQLGCSALSLCLVASGVIDGHVDLRGMLRATDAAAGLLILREAGGAYSVNGVIGGDLELTRQSRLNLVAASGREMLEVILGRVK